MKLVAKASAVTVLAIVAVLAGASSASANTAPNPYTPTGAAWVNVPAADRVHFEGFGSDWDDSSIASIPAGVTCTYNSITAVGPFLTSANLSATECTDAASAPFDPIDAATRRGAVDFGFDINFVGTTYNSAWPATNGALFFDTPSAAYDRSLNVLAALTGSGIFPLAGDLYYSHTESNFWTAKTVVDGHPAVVFSWEKFNNCCNVGNPAEDMSFQLVLISTGSGDFNAQFNYSSFSEFDEGFLAPTFLVDLATGVTPGSNVLVADDITNIAAGCTRGYNTFNNSIGTATDTVFESATDNNLMYFNIVDASARTLSLWSDAACTVPINVNVAQNVAANGHAYVELGNSTGATYSVAAGWSSLDSVTSELSSLDLIRNVNTADLENGQPGAFNQRSLNSTVPGRFVIGQRAGVTVTDPALLGITAAAVPAPALAATGVSTDLGTAGVLTGVLLLLGAAGLVVARRARVRMA